MNINDALIKHDDIVSKEYETVMTVLIGSQNYGLDTDKSDYDTFSFVLPKMEDIATLRDPVSTTRSDELGHIDIKDIRLGLNLLKKTSPNSVECFSFKHAIINGRYSAIMEDYLVGNPYILRCNTKHMMKAIGGMSYELSKRNMPAGKRLAHMLRMHCMVHNYFDIGKDLLSLTEDERKLALQAKQDPDNPKWEKLIEEYGKIVREEVNNVDLGYFDEHSAMAIATINDVQCKLINDVFSLTRGVNQ